MREHQDFIPELDFVLEENGRIIGNIMYTRAKLVDEGRPGKGDPDLRPRLRGAGASTSAGGYGKALMEHSFARAAELGYDAIVIFCSPANYVSRGFQSCKKFQVSPEGG